MKQRFTVRKDTANKYYWCVWDRLENKVSRYYSNLPCAKSLCKYLNNQNKKAVSA